MKRLLLMLSISLPLTACGDHSTSAGRVQNALISQTWTLRWLNNKSVQIETNDAPTLRFMADRRIEGSSTCNKVFSPERWWNVLGYEFHWDWPGSEYRWSADTSGIEGRFEPAPMAMTAIGCGGESADRIGKAFWKAMQHARQWSLHNRQIVIGFADGGKAVLIPLPSRVTQ